MREVLGAEGGRDLGAASAQLGGHLAPEERGQLGRPDGRRGRSVLARGHPGLQEALERRVPRATPGLQAGQPAGSAATGDGEHALHGAREGSQHRHHRRHPGEVVSLARQVIVDGVSHGAGQEEDIDQRFLDLPALLSALQARYLLPQAPDGLRHRGERVETPGAAAIEAGLCVHQRPGQGRHGVLDHHGRGPGRAADRGQAFRARSQEVASRSRRLAHAAPAPDIGLPASSRITRASLCGS